MKLTTKLDRKRGLPIRHNMKILAMGSCFATNMGQRMKRLKWDISVNPMGIVYNPMSLFLHLEYLSELQHPDLEQYFEHQGLFHHFDFHGDMSKPSLNEAKEHLENVLLQSKRSLQSADVLILTFGTSWIYRNLEQDRLVANCHKIPAAQFSRELLELQTMQQKAEEVLGRISGIFPDLEILISVSPVRHLSDGLIQNNRSKAQLLLLAHDLQSHFDFVHYFPGYELLIDEMRDYRFYDRDLSHPNTLAMDYIWDFWCECHLDETTNRLVEQISRLNQGFNHKPIHSQTPAHQSFLKNMIQKMHEMEQEHPHISWSTEIEILQSQINQD